MNEIFLGLMEFLAWPSPLFMFLGAMLGLLFGFLPGLGGAQALALLTPITFGMPSNVAIAMLIGAMGAVPFGGSISAILINTPGTPQNAATTFDGFPLTKQGKAGYALGASASASVLGAIFGVLILSVLIPLGKPVVLAFSYPEYFMMALMGISVIAVVSLGSIWKGLAAGVLGLLFTTIGYDPVTGSLRYVFGSDYLYDGIKIVPALIGLFAISESLEMMVKGKDLTSGAKMTANMNSGVWEGIMSVFKHLWLFIRCSAIGTIIGVIPGVGGSVANFLAYGHAVSTTRDNPHFGQGDIRGVIAPQSSDTAKDGGAMVPTILFGIPGSVETAVLLGALILHGIQPGPKLLIDNPTVVYVIIFSLVVSNIIAGVFGLLGAKYLARLTLLPVKLIASMIFALAIVGAYATHGVWEDVVLAFVFGIIGYFLNRYGFTRVPLVIALVLGTMFQQTYHQTMSAMGWQGFFMRPISLVVFLTTVLMLIMPFIKAQLSKKKGGIKY
ncbi:tripartite tricarboxylate transporter permease [Desulfosporosinus sp. BICA1-9]|uniref:tripartite tricarboxylate transporter permease n=1 Tax=Desulfosporosinus sp. BICA1-9 TaxID=1531958 RepID=UPI00054BE7E3|nr:tripartite tricarboxylate transporter permease [Desulfosporosinus sp. BICA1-9]KJS48821.1 MAG: tricarboxylate transport membrane protein TctA [Peptococcaceae bacterium BRH_c23]KJS87089.1 MAG: tricarboxylate transport membrane protein TctA [Desulfosporosinus sp. BICA1-9]HBW34163.1 tricarboxylic transporter [Desulfosporosinus sp.]